MMQQGLASLAPAQGPQGPQGMAPGQAAPQQVLPQPQGATPQAVTGTLEKLPPQQLLAMYNNPQDMTPKWAVATAYAKAIEQARLMQMAQGQSAMAQSAAQGQQPPVAQQIMSQPIPAAQGGIMQGYAGGGAVAFAGGGTTPFGRLLESITEAVSPSERNALAAEIARRYASAASGTGLFMEQSDAARRKAQDVMSRLGSMSVEDMRSLLEEETYGLEGRRVRQESPAAPSAAPPAASSALPASAPQRAPRPDTGRPAATAAAAPAAAPITGLPALSAERQAQIKADEEKAALLAQGREALVRQMAQPSPEVLTARERLQKALSGAYDPQKQALEEAKAEKARGLFGNAEAMGLMARAAGRGKRFGQAIGEAVGAGAEFVGEQRKRIQSLQDRYNDLTAQLNITMAQAQYADVVGDDKLKRDALTKAEDIKAELFNTQRVIRKEAIAEQAQQATGIAALRKAAADETSARAQMISAGRPTEAQSRESLFRRDPKAYEAMYGAKESAAVANLVRAVNTDPALKSYAEALKLGTPTAEAAYNARYKELVAMYAPELLLGASGGSGGGALEAATAVVRGGTQ